MLRRHLILVAFATTLALFLHTQFSIPRASALSNPCAQDSNNLTTNGSMFGLGHSTPYGIVADGWIPFVLSTLLPTYEWVNNEKSPGDPGGSQYLWADLDATTTFDAGIYQTITGLTPGNYYHFWWGYSLAAYDPGNQINTRGNLIGRQVGVDATGGTNANAPTVSWGSVYWNGIAALNIPTLSMTFTAQTTNATIFLRAIAMQPRARDKIWFDSICMERVATPPTSARVFLPMVASNTGVTQTICTTTNIATVTVGTSPKGIAADSASNRVYVGLFDDSSIAVIDTTTNQKIATWSTSTPGGHSNGVGVTNGRLIVSLRDISSVVILDAMSGSVIATRTVGSLPYGVGAANGRAWVANFGSNSVSVIDVASTNVVTTTTTGSSPSLIASASDRAYVSFMGNGVAVIGNDGSLLNNIISTGADTFGVALYPSANRLYTTNRNTFATSIVDLGTNLVVNSATEPVEPVAIAVNPATNHLFIILPSINTVRVRDAATLAFIKDLPIGAQGNDGGDGIVVANNRVYISNNSAGTVSVIQDVCQ